ncbi:putative T7SS-secreted protein [Streptomyces chrestomyceticus]|uniref:putative T7SS-secreted protein n=1 Tax=Streptomyces chrestomyceticus TaxID=68185 RepID=UPI0004C671B4
MSDDWSGLGWNPTPGHPHLATNLADNLKRTAETLKSAFDLLDTLDKGSTYWTGKAAKEFSDHVKDLPKYLDKAQDSLKEAGVTLAKWSDSLDNMKKKEAHYEADAKGARKKIKEAEDSYTSAKQHPDLKLAGRHFATDAELKTAEGKLDAARSRVDSAVEKVDAPRPRPSTWSCRLTWTNFRPRSTRRSTGWRKRH